MSVTSVTNRYHTHFATASSWRYRVTPLRGEVTPVTTAITVPMPGNWERSTRGAGLCFRAAQSGFRLANHHRPHQRSCSLGIIFQKLAEMPVKFLAAFKIERNVYFNSSTHNRALACAELEFDPTRRAFPGAFQINLHRIRRR